MSIYSEIDRLELAKQNLKLKLESKGITVPVNARISDYAALINLLPEIKENEFTNRIVDNGNSGTGKAKIYNIKGKSITWNQKLNMSLAYTEVGGLTFTLNSDKTITINGTTTQAFGVSIFIANTIIDAIPAGRKVLWRNKVISGSVTVPTGSVRFGTGYGSYLLDVGQSIIINEAGGKSKQGIVIYCDEGVTFSNLRVAFNLFDLTLMFGAGNEPSTVKEFEAIFPDIYYPYNIGTLINNDAEDIESIGFNQFDEELLILGKWRDSNNVEQDIAERRRSDEYSYCLPNTQYFVKGNGINRFTAVICWYDADKNFIIGNALGLGEIVTSPINAFYFRMSSAEVSNTIIVNFSNPTKNGTYEPYKKDTCHLGLNSFRVKDSEDNIITINGLKSAGSVYDEIDLVRNKYIKRVGSVDLGSLTWVADGSRPAIFISLGIADSAKKSSSGYDRANVICSKYLAQAVQPTYDGSFNKAIGIYTNGNTYVRDTVYSESSADQFKAAMDGVYLNYELATPIEYDLVDEIDTIYDVDKDGVERIVSPIHADGSPSAPFKASIGYPVNQE